MSPETLLAEVTFEHTIMSVLKFQTHFVQMILYSTDYYQCLTLESWFTNLEQMPLNHSQQLPVPYKRLTDEIKQD